MSLFHPELPQRAVWFDSLSLIVFAGPGGFPGAAGVPARGLRPGPGLV